MEPLTSAQLFNMAKERTDNPSSVELVREMAHKVFGHVGPEHPALEFGTRWGGSALALLSAILDRDRIRPLITVDPYGDLPYHADLKEVSWTYSNAHYRGTMSRLSSVAEGCGLNWMHLMMKDSDYMEHLWSSVPIYLCPKPLLRPTFSFVYLDAEHTEEAVRRQLTWLKGKIAKGGLVVVDDADWLKDRGESLKKEFGGVSMEVEEPNRIKKWILISG
jgi:hypothetical protein